MSSVAAPQRILGSAGRPVRFAVAAGSHSLAVLEKQPQSNEELRRSFGTPVASPHDQWASMHTVSAVSPSFVASFASFSRVNRPLFEVHVRQPERAVF